MAEIYEDELTKRQKPVYEAGTYAPTAPTATYQDDPAWEAFQQRIHEAAQGIDPQRQAEEDARIRRGREFWTGANLLANVVANAINVHGTANGAPNMTWNDTATQKMYDTWRQRDKELKADREKARQRYDTLANQEMTMRMADKKAQDAADLAAYNENWKAQEAARKAQFQNDTWEWQHGLAQDEKLAAEQRAIAKEKELYDYKRLHPMPSRSASGSGGGKKPTASKNAGKWDLKVGNMTMPAATEKGQNQNIYDMSEEMYDYLQKNPDAMGGKYRKKERPTDSNGRRKFVNDVFQDLYDNDEAFRRRVDEYFGDRISFEDAGQAMDTLQQPMDTIQPAPQAKQPGYGRLRTALAGGKPSMRQQQPMQRSDIGGYQQADTVQRQVTDTIRQPVQQAPQQVGDTAVQQSPRQQYATAPAEGTRYVKGKDGRTYMVEDDGDVYLKADNGYRSFVGNVRDNNMSKILDGIPFTEEEYANLGQWQRRPSAKNNPMMAAPDLSVEKTKQFNDWFTNNTKKK